MSEMRTMIDGTVLRAIPDLLSEITELAEFRPGDDDWTVAAYSPARDRAVELNIHAEAFHDHCVPAPFAVRVKDLVSVCRTMAKADEVAMTIGPRVVFEAGGFRVTVPTEPVSEGRRPPSEAAGRMTLDAEAVTTPDGLVRVLRACDPKVTVSCTLKLDADGLTLDTTDEEMGRGVCVTVPPTELDSSDGQGLAHYGLDGLKGLMEAMPAGRSASLMFGTDMPLVMTFRVGAMDCMYLIAPRIESA